MDVTELTGVKTSCQTSGGCRSSTDPYEQDLCVCVCVCVCVLIGRYGIGGRGEISVV